MEQDRNKEHLKKLLEFLEHRIFPAPDNQWFVKDLYAILAPASDARISDIHEQCIESILQQQADEFYQNFVIEEIRPQLIADFIKMEHWRRRNNIQEFCMALYQQIEAVTNYIANNNDLNLIWRNIRNAGFSVNLKSKDICDRWGEKSIEQGIVYKKENYGKELNSLLAMDKFKAILFLIVWKTNVHINNINFFDNDFHTGNDIYQIRNLNHRGKVNPEDKSERVTAILEHPTTAMCTLLGFYARFISGINNGYPLSKSTNLVEFAHSCCKSN